MKRTYTTATLRTRAFGKIERISQKIDQAAEAKTAAMEKYDKRIARLGEELHVAQEEFRRVSGELPGMDYDPGTLAEDPEKP